MRWLGSERVIGLDAEAVAGALVAYTPRGLRVRAFFRVPISPGALVPSPFEENLVRPEEVRDALTKVSAALGDAGRVCLVLPDGLARTVLLESGDAPPREYARFRLTPGLPYPASEAVIDVLPLPGGRLLASAVRRSVIEGYESVVAAAGLPQDRLDLSPLAALAGLQKTDGAPAGGVDVVLGDVAVSFAVHRDGALRVFRTRRRDPGPGEIDRLSEEIDRTAALAGEGTVQRVRVVGGGALDLVRELSFRGRTAEPGWQVAHDGLPVEPSELAWLGAALA